MSQTITTTTKDGKKVVVTRDDLHKLFNAVDTAGTAKAAYCGSLCATWVAENSKERDQKAFGKAFDVADAAVSRAMAVYTFSLLNKEDYSNYTLNAAVAWGRAVLIGKGGKGHLAASELVITYPK